MSRKNMTGIHVRAKSDMNFPTSQPPTGVPPTTRRRSVRSMTPMLAANISGPIGSGGPDLKRPDDLVRGGERDAALAPGGGAGGGAAVVQAARGVLDEGHAAPAQEHSPDGGVVAH